MKKLLLIFLLLSVLQPTFAQKVTVVESSDVVGGISKTGLSTLIQLDQKKVQKAWEKQLKSYGKLDYSKGAYTIPIANIPSVSSQPCIVASIVKSVGKGTQVWWAIDMGTEHVTASGSSSAYRAAEKILYEFAVECYRDDINEQIEEAESALQSTVKTQERKIKDGQELSRDVEKNKQEKLSLEQKLKENGEELVQLQKDIEQNKKDQAAAASDVDKMRKAVEMVKQKLNGIGK